jgi:ligand-binding sensor domain-containing protein
VATPSAAQERGLRFEHLTVEDGLPSSWVYDITKDRRGFMWFATAGGLTRYDGRRYVVYHLEGYGPGSGPNPDVVDVFEDDDGRLWAAFAGTHAAVALYDPTTDTLRLYPLGDPVEGRRFTVNSLAGAENGHLWLGTEAGLWNLDPSTGAVTRLRHDPEDTETLSDDEVRRLFRDREGDLWIGTASGLDRLDRDNRRIHRWRSHGDDVDPLASASISDLYEDESGALWVATMGSGLFRLDTERSVVKQYLPQPNDPASLSTALLRRVAGDRHGMLYIGTEDSGLNVWDTRTDRATRYAVDPLDSDSVSSRSIWSVYVDDQELLWLGTLNAGVDRASSQGPRFGVIRAGTNGLSAPQVSALMQDHRGDLWIGTDGGGLDRLDRQTGLINRYRHEPGSSNGLSSNAILSLYEDDDERVWIGTWEGGLQRLDPVSGRFTTFRPDFSKAGALHYEHVRVILPDTDGRLLLGTQEGGVVEMDVESRRFTSLRDRYPEIAARKVYAMALDASGNLWIVQADVERVDRQTGEVTSYPLEGGWVYDVQVDSKNNIWFGTETGGVCIFETKTGLMHRYDRKDGLPSNRVLSVVDDSEGNVWLGTSRGLVRLADGTSLPKAPQMLVFDVRDGLPGYEFRQGAKLQTPNGEIYLGGQRGLTYFTPEEIRIDRRVPPVSLTGLALMNKPVRPGETGPWSRSTGETEELILAPKHRVVSFEFAALDYATPGKNRYRYRLEGFDPDWSPPSTAARATYTNLPAGSYRFEVVAANGDDVWAETGASVRVYKRPRLLERVWFFPALFALVLALAAATHRRRVVRHRQLEVELKQSIRVARAEIQTLHGLLPICTGCGSVRDDAGYWSQLDVYVANRTEAAFSHGICPDCAKEYRAKMRRVSEAKQTSAGRTNDRANRV